MDRAPLLSLRLFFFFSFLLLFFLVSLLFLSHAKLGSEVTASTCNPLWFWIRGDTTLSTLFNPLSSVSECLVVAILSHLFVCLSIYFLAGMNSINQRLIQLAMAFDGTRCCGRSSLKTETGKINCAFHHAKSGHPYKGNTWKNEIKQGERKNARKNERERERERERGKKREPRGMITEKKKEKERWGEKEKKQQQQQKSSHPSWCSDQILQWAMSTEGFSNSVTTNIHTHIYTHSRVRERERDQIVAFNCRLRMISRSQTSHG